MESYGYAWYLYCQPWTGGYASSIGVHTAKHVSTPMILLIGQVEREFAGRESFQEIDYRLMFAPLTKWVAEIDRASRVPELVSRASKWLLAAALDRWRLRFPQTC